MYYPSLEQFTQLFAEKKVVPVCRELFMDLETPISLYQKVCQPYSYLLESVEGGERLARYSFIGVEPFLILQGKNGHITITEQKKEEKKEGNPLEILESLMQKYQGVNLPSLPRFAGGAVGYFAYDAVRYLEKLPQEKKDDLQLPDVFFLFTRVLLVFDHVQHKVKVLVNVLPEEIEPEIAYEEAKKKIDEVVILLKQATPLSQTRSSLDEYKVKSNFTQVEFEGCVKKAQDYIRAGDIFQVGLSQRFEMSIDVDPLAIYRSLRAINPSPYMYYLNYGEAQIIGTSPEMLLRVEEDDVVTRPIAGTRPRGKTKAEDLLLAEDLLKDEKERAEHVMLVDLHRNDIGKVSRFGSVEVDQFMEIERYSHVMHLVSNIKGKLQDKINALEAFAASFPAGTVSGAPKIRAMEIIEELEPNRRGIYAGAVGYWSFNGNLDTCITIRTIVVKEKKAYIQAGAGIVADSIPALEYQETVNKAQALLQAVILAHGGGECEQRFVG